MKTKDTLLTLLCVFLFSLTTIACKEDDDLEFGQTETDFDAGVTYRAKQTDSYRSNIQYPAAMELLMERTFIRTAI
jgi:hypothetical protein